MGLIIAMLCRNCGKALRDHIGWMQWCDPSATYGTDACFEAVGHDMNIRPQHYHGIKEDIKLDPGPKFPEDLLQDLVQANISISMPKPINPKFHSALQKMAEVHDKKSADYAHDGNRYSNFEEAAAIAGVSVDDVFAVLIGIKLSRLRELLKSGKTPNNESIQDTRLDLAVYSVLWLSYHE